MFSVLVSFVSNIISHLYSTSDLDIFRFKPEVGEKFSISMIGLGHGFIRRDHDVERVSADKHKFKI